jgi:hypothetical protein
MEANRKGGTGPGKEEQPMADEFVGKTIASLVVNEGME